MALMVQPPQPRFSGPSHIRWETATADGGSDSGNGEGHELQYQSLDGAAVEIALDPELLTTFCRRGRRRLRDIQASCQATVKLDRTRGVLRVAGSEASIQAVRRQLASLGGPRRPVSSPVWAELMRTRTMRFSDQAAVARLQQESGCRIHIERSRQEVRLFGPGEGVAVADRLLEELATQCTEEAVPVDASVTLASQALQSLAHSRGVTLRVEEAQVVVLGLAHSVAHAVGELRRYIAEPQAYQPAVTPPDVPSEADSSPSPDAKSSRLKPWSGAQRHVESFPQEDHHSDGQQLGVVTTKMPPSAAVAAAEQEWARQHRAQVSHAPRGRAKDHQQLKGCASTSGFCRVCPTCGAGRFCVFCGAPTWQVESMNLAAYAAQAAHRHCAASGWASAAGSKPGTPDSEQALAPWTPNVHVMSYEGGSMPHSYQGHPGMVHSKMVPVCFPRTMAQGGTSVAAGGAAGSNGQMMQACVVPAMVPACMLAHGHENGLAFCAMPAGYMMQDMMGPVVGA